jgi:cytochrome c551
MLYWPYSEEYFLAPGEMRMKSGGVALITLAITIFATACNNSGTIPTSSSQPSAAASPALTATPDEFASARANFAKHCSVCHGNEGNGGVVTIENVKLKVPSLREGHALTHTDEKLAKQITNGGDGMPAFKDKLTPQEIGGLVRFVRKEFQGK